MIINWWMAAKYVPIGQCEQRIIFIVVRNITQRSARDRRRLVNHNTIPGAEYSQNYVKIQTYSSSRSSKVDDFGTNRKRICEFLFVINSNFGPILHRF